MRLVTNSLKRIAALEGYGLHVTETVAIPADRVGPVLELKENAS